MDRDYCRHRLKGPRCVGIEVRPPFPFNLCMCHALLVGCALDHDNAHINHFPFVAVSARPAYPNPTYRLATTNLLDCFDISLIIVVSADSDAISISRDHWHVNAHIDHFPNVAVSVHPDYPNAT